MALCIEELLTTDNSLDLSIQDTILFMHRIWHTLPIKRDSRPSFSERKNLLFTPITFTRLAGSFCRIAAVAAFSVFLVFPVALPPRSCMKDTTEWPAFAQGKALGFASLLCHGIQPDTKTPFGMKKGIGAMASREVLANNVNVSISAQRVLRAICPEERSPTRGGQQAVFLFAGTC